VFSFSNLRVCFPVGYTRFFSCGHAENIGTSAPRDPHFLEQGCNGQLNSVSILIYYLYKNNSDSSLVPTPRSFKLSLYFRFSD
jgi:hypothetical protein